MFRVCKRNRFGLFIRGVSLFIAFTFFFTTVIPPGYAQSMGLLNLPPPGAMVSPSPAFMPVMLKGMTVHPENPLQFDFIIDSGSADLTRTQVKADFERLVKYFLAAMTVPQDDLWVNLSPHEKDRVIPDELGRTELGRDMLAQDYLLKQVTASMIYPEEKLGQRFWDRVYDQAAERFGTTDIPVNTFNKVWIMPQTAQIYENGHTVYIVNSRLKVLLDEDYKSLRAHENSRRFGTDRLAASDVEDSSEISAQIVREIIIPELEREVNEGENFAQIRQIYHSLILAQWYKETVKESLLSKVYVDQKKTKGVDVSDPAVKEKIYARYVDAFKQGVFDYIREDYDRLSQEPIPRKYFAGGEEMGHAPLENVGKERVSDAAKGKGDFAGRVHLRRQGDAELKQTLARVTPAARSLATRAGEIMLGIRREGSFGIETKADQTIVTRADKEIQRMMDSELMRLIPGSVVIGEESFTREAIEKAKQAEYVWIVDPIDGTKVYAAGGTGYSFSVSLLKKGRPVYALIFAPEYDIDGSGSSLWEASEAEDGVFFNGEKVFLDDQANDLAEAKAAFTDSSVDPAPVYYKQVLSRAREAVSDPDESGFIKMGRLILSSRIKDYEQLYLKPRSKLWDILQGAYLIRKAKGRATYDDGTDIFPLDFELISFDQNGSPRVPSVILGAPMVHAQALEIARAKPDITGPLDNGGEEEQKGRAAFAAIPTIGLIGALKDGAISVHDGQLADISSFAGLFDEHGAFLIIAGILAVKAALGLPAWGSRLVEEYRRGRTVRSLIKSLKNDFEFVRAEAAESLGRMGDLRAVEPLMALFGDWSSKVRFAAREALEKIGATKAQLFNANISALKSKSEDARREAAWALGELGDKSAVKPLMALFRDEDAEVRSAGRKAVRKLGATKRRLAIANIRALKSKSEDARREAAWALGELGDKSAVKPLMALFWDGASKVRFAAREAVEKLGVTETQIVDANISALKSNSDDAPRSRFDAVESLGELGDKRAVEPLIKLLGDEEESVRRAVAEALGKLGDKRAVEPLLALFWDEDAELRSAAREAVEKLGVTETQIVDANISALKSESKGARRDAVEALGELGDKRAVEPLIGLFGDKDSEVRRAAAESLGELGDPRAVEPLMALFWDEDAEVRSVAREAVEKLGATREQLVDANISALKSNSDDAPRSRFDAVESLGELGDKRAIQPLEDFFSHVRLSDSPASQKIRSLRAIVNSLEKVGYPKIDELLSDILKLEREERKREEKREREREEERVELAKELDRAEQDIRMSGLDEDYERYNRISDELYGLGDSRGDYVYICLQCEEGHEEPDWTTTDANSNGPYDFYWVVDQPGIWEGPVRRDRHKADGPLDNGGEEEQKGRAGLNTIIDYLAVRDPLPEKADLALVLGSADEQVPLAAARLYKEGRVSKIMVSGGAAKFIIDKTPLEQRDAMKFKRVLLREGIPEEDIITEPNSTSTDQNVEFSKQILEDKGIKHDKIILIQFPIGQRMAAEIFKKHFGREPISYAAYIPDVAETGDTELLDTAREALMHTARLTLHGPSGKKKIGQVNIPAGVQAAVQDLRDLYLEVETRRLVEEEDKAPDAARAEATIKVKMIQMSRFVKEISAEAIEQAKTALAEERDFDIQIERRQVKVIAKDTRGGIDMNRIDLEREGSAVEIEFDPVEMQTMLENGVEGFAPVIINLTPLPSILPVLGLEPRDRKEEYAKAE